MIGIWGKLRVAAGIVAGGVYLGLGYVAAASEHPPLIALLVGVLPLALLVLTSAWHSKMRWLAVPLALGACIWGALNVSRLEGHVASFYFVQHVGAMGLLGLMFGSTLWRGHAEALCSRIAVMVMPEALEPDYLRYTWWVTAVWTLFFAWCGATSVALFFAGPLAWWAFFANVLTPILVGALFVVEYLVRVRVLPDRPHMSIAGTVQAYQRFRKNTS